VVNDPQGELGASGNEESNTWLMLGQVAAIFLMQEASSQNIGDHEQVAH
jgi:hypothetical protein